MICTHCQHEITYGTSITSRSKRTYHASCFISDLIDLLDTIDELACDIINTTQTTHAAANRSARKIKRLIENGS